MVRFLYACLLRLHPRPFRQRYAGEMLWIFDQAIDSRARLMTDAVVSLWRQWALRPQATMQPAASAATLRAADGVPSFYTCERFKPRRSALINGWILSIAIFAALSYAIAHGGGHQRFPPLLIGSHRPHGGLIEVQTPPVASTDLDTAVEVSEERAESESWFTVLYFRVMPVLGALDANQDLVISSYEISNSPVALRTLDRNGDGKLTAEECGFGGGPAPDTNSDSEPRPEPLRIQRARSAFMRDNPVLAALDADHDGEISAAEIQNAPAALRSLDKNGHRRLTSGEVLPDPVAIVVSLFLSDFDVNGDGKLSKDERLNPNAGRFRDLLDAADQDRDGFVTRAELAKEIRRRAFLSSILTHEQMLAASRNGDFASPFPAGTVH
jgi:Ca2+-binding EF-hand superfamily protein